jgi:hypothetical protein
VIHITNDNFLGQTHAARLGPNHGYRIEGDIARLHADVAVEETSNAQWALQLWACERPFDGGTLQGVKVAEAALPLDEVAQSQRLDAEALASVPGGQRDYSMVLVLASGANGAFDQIHDFANYPARERFITPHLEGSVGYQVEGREVTLRAEGIRNPRRANNLSGSLALELWALADEYRGGPVFGGRLLASADAGRIEGQVSRQDFEQRVKFEAPAEGRWHVVLMLREWVPGGYVTRDFCTFAEQYVVEPQVAPESIPAANTNATIEAPDALHVPKADGRLSIMTASVEELAKLKGLTKKVAVEIVKGRPYASLDELTRVRGIGPKMLAKLRPLIAL